jgi:uncharacterized phosphatase
VLEFSYIFIVRFSMIIKKSFYFVRHGQTEHNAKKLITVSDENPPLNMMGQNQARSIASLVKSLDIDTIAHSPLHRVIETMTLCTDGAAFPKHSIEELKECTSGVWLKMISLKHEETPCTLVQPFIEQVTLDVNTALGCGDAVLIVAHGGVHWALCRLLQIAHHDWDLDNCGVVCFSPDLKGRWSAKLLNK